MLNKILTVFSKSWYILLSLLLGMAMDIRIASYPDNFLIFGYYFLNKWFCSKRFAIRLGFNILKEKIIWEIKETYICKTYICEKSILKVDICIIGYCKLTHNALMLVAKDIFTRFPSSQVANCLYVGMRISLRIQPCRCINDPYSMHFNPYHAGTEYTHILQTV